MKYIAEIEDIKLENITEQKIVDEIEYLNQNSRNVAFRVREKGMYEIRVRCRIRCFTLNDDGMWIGENVYEDRYDEEFFIQRLDTTPPSDTILSASNTEWTKENVTLTVNAEDAESGLENQAYSFDGGTTWQESNQKTYTENTNGIVIKVKDNARNISTSEPINITKIRRIQSITIKTQPNKTKYILNEDLDTTGLVIYLNYDNGDKEEINQNFTCTPTKLTQVGTQKITVTYEDKSVNFYVEVKEEPSKPVEIIVESEKYKIEKGIIKNTQPKTQLLEFKRNIKTNSKTIKVLKDTNEITNTEKLATGMKMLLDNNVYYKIIVKGDCNGDGQANLQDILLINKHRLNKTQLKNEYLTAGDTDEDGKVEIKNILKLNKYRLNKIEEYRKDKNI